MEFSNTAQLIQELFRHKKSVLKQSKEGRALRRVFGRDDAFVGFLLNFCLSGFVHVFANLLSGEKLPQAEYRQWLAKKLRFFVPYKEVYMSPVIEPYQKNDRPRILVTNHPSDNELVILGSWSILNSHRRLIFPIDYPRFEGFGVRIYDKLIRIMNAILAPVLPPGSMEFLNDHEKYIRFQNMLNQDYAGLVCDSWVAVTEDSTQSLPVSDTIIAQQCQFQEHLFVDRQQYLTGRSETGQKIRKPIGNLLQAAVKRGIDIAKVDLIFMPVELNGKSNRLNLCREYPVHISPIFTAAEWLNRVGGRFADVDYRILRYMADEMGMPTHTLYPQF
jgi:hypothetical protein